MTLASAQHNNDISEHIHITTIIGMVSSTIWNRLMPTWSFLPGWTGDKPGKTTLRATHIFLDTSHSDYEAIIKENTRRNTLVHQRSSLSISLPPSPPSGISAISSMPSSSCRRCTGTGQVPKPCPHCKASGKVFKNLACIDCDAERNGCGNYNCRICQGVGLISVEGDCWNCNGSGCGLRLSCGDCGGTGREVDGDGDGGRGSYDERG